MILKPPKTFVPVDESPKVTDALPPQPVKKLSGKEKEMEKESSELEVSRSIPSLLNIQSEDPV
jgi:hypothetical protein